MSAAVHESGGHADASGSASQHLDTSGASEGSGGGTVEAKARPKSPLHLSTIHESGYLHTSGEAIYVDDIPAPRGMLVGMVVGSPYPRARILKRDVSAAKLVPGVAAVLTAEDIPGHNDVAPFTHDEPLLAEDEVFAVGQSLAVVIADSYETCRKAAAKMVWEWEELPAVLTVQDAIQQQSYLTEPHVMKRGDVDQALAEAPVRFQGEVSTGGQDHFYLETHAALALPLEDGTYHVYSSTQHPSEVQAKVAEALGIRSHQVVVEVKRMGGGFGGKETQGAIFASLAALGSLYTKRPVKIWLNRDQDMVQTGKRHPFFSRYDAGFDNDGKLLALRVEGFSDGGWTSDLSGPILDRYMFHLDNAYYIPSLRLEARVARTNTVSNTAFRGFGGPQGMVVVETVMEEAAARLGMDPAVVRQRNFYGPAPRNMTPYWQEVPADRSQRVYDELTVSSNYAERRKEIDTFNASSTWIKRGISYQPVKFGISFTNSMLNQAGAFVLVYADGSVQLNHGGTEMGQGLHTKMISVCAHELGVPVEDIRLMSTATDKVPNTSATAASSGSDLNGAAVQNACQKLIKRLRPIAASLLQVDDPSALVFADGWVYPNGQPEHKVAFSAVAMQAYVEQVSLSATGFYRTPDIAYSAAEGRGKPFHYFAYGGAVLEVEVNAFTGEYRLLRADILHDVGHSLVPSIDQGQVEGAFIQGLGWLTCEELVWSKDGHLRTHSPDTYKIPAVGEAPVDFRVHLLERAAQDNVIHGSKAVGEPPFMLGIGIVSALRHAIAGFSSQAHVSVPLALPATPEAVLRAIEDVGFSSTL
ncbi:MAG: xanthine dehydrogenase molybdopterin binding subunit [Deltaproteobacteria bacterium]|nr:MAG: xanthine dehydrogenase molybdopterin binding subunit [Deltaproteobacteria bacterium]